MFRLTCLIIIAVHCVNVYGQDNTSNGNIDSLRKKSIQLLRDDNFAQADSLLSILIIRKNEIDPLMVPTLYNNKGIALYGIGQYVEGITQYKKALSIYKSTKRDTMYAQALVNLGMAYKEIGADSLASQTLYRAVDRFQSMGLKKEESSALNSLGNLYRDSKNFTRAEYFFRKSLKLRQSIDYKKGVAYSYHGLGRLMLEKKNYKDDKLYLFRSLRMKESLNLESKPASTLAQ
jgi:tetratricopeptide (TPR) repeat protein